MRLHKTKTIEHIRPGDGANGQRRWIGVDLDGTLTNYTTWEEMGPTIGKPVPAMVERIRRWLAEGTYEVKIFTARACKDNWNQEKDFETIKALCVNLFGRELEITNQKDFAMAQLWDDLAVTVESNTGYRTARSSDMAWESGDPLGPVEEIDLLPLGSPAQVFALAGRAPAPKRGA
jgi:hypothetical protein